MGTLMLFSCEASYGEKYIKGNLEIFYTEECENYVLPVAEYFDKNQLIQESPHSILLTSSSLGSDNPGFIMKMILSDIGKPLPESEQNNLELLQEDIKHVIYNDANFRIVVCNENFVPI